MELDENHCGIGKGIQFNFRRFSESERVIRSTETFILYFMFSPEIQNRLIVRNRTVAVQFEFAVFDCFDAVIE